MIRISPAIVSDFAVQDKETNAIPFRIDAGAPTNAMKLSTDGNLGLGSGPLWPSFTWSPPRIPRSSWKKCRLRPALDRRTSRHDHGPGSFAQCRPDPTGRTLGRDRQAGSRLERVGARAPDRPADNAGRPDGDALTKRPKQRRNHKAPTGQVSCTNRTTIIREIDHQAGCHPYSRRYRHDDNFQLPRRTGIPTLRPSIEP